MSLSHDGKRIISGSWDKTIKVWNAETGEEKLTLRGHDSDVRSFNLNIASDRIVSGSSDKTIKV